MRFAAGKMGKAWSLSGFNSQKLKHQKVRKVFLGICLWERVPFLSLFAPFSKTPTG